MIANDAGHDGGIWRLVPLALTFIVCGFLVVLLWLEVLALNHFINEPILTTIRLPDILVGLTVYLKTSIDFAIYIGRLMDKNPGIKGRIGIEIGTALGNALGTMLVLLIWAFFKEVNWLLGLMVLLAGLVLMRLAQDGVSFIDTENKSYPKWFRIMVKVLDKALAKWNKVVDPFLSKIVPSHTLKAVTKNTLLGLLAISFTVPFLLGLDDFAGYVPLFNIVNVFGFGIGVIVGHMLLNIFLFISPKKTIAAVKNPVISFLGSIAFIGLAVWGFIEAYKLFFLHH
jgi:hypothetical protein